MKGSSRFGELRVNNRIRVPEVRVIGSGGEMVGIMPTRKALELARGEGLDLVEVNPKAIPPVCKIMDYGKFKYEKKKREREARRQQAVVELKEIKFRPTTDKHDVEVKVKKIREFLEDNSRVKLTVRFRGREIAHQEIGRNLLLRIAEKLSGVGSVSQQPRSDGRQMTMIISPKGKDKSGSTG